jgi:hypothetical protein
VAASFVKLNQKQGLPQLLVSYCEEEHVLAQQACGGSFSLGQTLQALLQHMLLFDALVWGKDCVLKGRSGQDINAALQPVQRCAAYLGPQATASIAEPLQQLQMQLQAPWFLAACRLSMGNASMGRDALMQAVHDKVARSARYYAEQLHLNKHHQRLISVFYNLMLAGLQVCAAGWGQSIIISVQARASVRDPG